VLFRRFKKPAPEETPKVVRSCPVGDEEAALDATAALLRIWGSHALDTEAVDSAVARHEFEMWARHVLLVAPPPGFEGEVKRRDWRGLERFVEDNRKGECDWIERTHEDLRQVIWLFVQSLGRALSEDRHSDSEMSHQLATLKEACDSADTAVLKEQVLASVGLIEELLSDRSGRAEDRIHALSGRIDRMKLELVEVRKQLSTDPLTKVHSRAAFDEQVSRITNLGTLFGSPSTLFVMDVDDFKWVNDRFGHTVGDEVLTKVADCLKNAFRRKGDFVARYGGDEFVALILDDSPDNARGIAERVLFAVREIEIDGQREEPIRVSVSMGAAKLEPGDEPGSWFERADRALYSAKEAGRDRCIIDGGGTHATEIDGGHTLSGQH